MPYIKIKFEGHKTFGGYLTIDGKRYDEIELRDNQLIYISSGFHQLNINSMNRGELATNEMRRGNPNSARYWDEWSKYEKRLDCTINHDFGIYDEMTIFIMSGYNKAILETPKYTVKTLSKEEYDILRKNEEKQREEMERQRKEEAIWEANRPINKLKKLLATAKKVICWMLFAFFVFLTLFGGGKTTVVIFLIIIDVILFFVSMKNMKD